MKRYTDIIVNNINGTVEAYVLKPNVSNIIATQRLGRFEDNIKLMRKLKRETKDVGYYNGIETCLALLENREPKYM